MCSGGVVLMKLLPATQCLQVLAKCNVDEVLDEKTWESWTGGGQGSYLSRSMCAAVHCAHCAFVCIVTIVSLERQQ